MMSRPNYLNEAFKIPANLIALGTFFVMGVVGQDILPILVGACLEIGYLLFAPNTRSMHKYVDDRERARQLDERYERASRLSTEDSERAKELISLYKRLGEELANHDDADLLMGSEYHRFEEMIGAFINLSEARTRLTDFPRDIENLKTQIKSVATKLKAETIQPATKATWEKQKEILERRLSILTGLTGQMEQIKAKMDIIDSTFRLMYDQFNLYKTTGGTLTEQVDDILRETSALQSILPVEDAVPPQVEELDPTPPNVRRIRG